MGVCICPSLSSLDAPRVAIPLRRGRISLCECQESTVNFAEYQLILVMPMFLDNELLLSVSWNSQRRGEL